MKGKGNLRRIRPQRESCRVSRRIRPRAPDTAFAIPAMLGNHRSLHIPQSEAWACAVPAMRVRNGSSMRCVKTLAYLSSIGLLNLISFLPMPCASYQCSSASQIVPSASRTVAMPFIFRHFPAPYSRTSRRRSRRRVPEAIVANVSIGPRSSNSTLRA